MQAIKLYQQRNQQRKQQLKLFREKRQTNRIDSEEHLKSTSIMGRVEEAATLFIVLRNWLTVPFSFGMWLCGTSHPCAFAVFKYAHRIAVSACAIVCVMLYLLLYHNGNIDNCGLGLLAKKYLYLEGMTFAVCCRNMCSSSFSSTTLPAFVGLVLVIPNEWMNKVKHGGDGSSPKFKVFFIKINSPH